MSERGSRILDLKGYPRVVVEPELIVVSEEMKDSQRILDEYRKKRILEKDVLEHPDKWDDLETIWNPDDTMNYLVAFRNGEVVYRKDFIWNRNGSLNKIVRM